MSCSFEKTTLNLEKITEFGHTYRLKVFKGWMVINVSGMNDTGTSIFVPDPNHEWEHQIKVFK